MRKVWNLIFIVFSISFFLLPLNNVKASEENERVSKEEFSQPVFENNTDAANYVRKELVERNEKISLVYRLTIPNTGLPSGTAVSIYDEALKVTNSAVEGDYLKYNIRSRNVSTEIQGNDGEYSYYLLSYTMTYLTSAAEEANVTTFVNELIISLGMNNSSLSDAEKTKKLYDYLGTNVYYDHDGYEFEKDQIESGAENVEWTATHSAYSALLTNSSLCQGYALSVYRVLKEVGIEVRFIRGQGYKNDDAEHAIHDFNIVKVDGKWYYLDANWGAMFKESNGGTSTDIDYSWFLKDKQDFAYHEIVEENLSSNHECYNLEDPTSANYTSQSYGDSLSSLLDGYDASYTFYNLSDKEIKKPENKIVVMTLFRNGWVNTNYWLKELADSKYFDSDFIDFYAVDINKNPDYTSLLSMANKTGFGVDNVMYQSEHYKTKTYLSDLANTLLTNVGYKDYDFYFNYNLPVTLIIDKSNQVEYVINAGKEMNGKSVQAYISTEYLDQRIDYLLSNPSNDTRTSVKSPTEVSSICVQRPDGAGIYAGALVGVTGGMEYRESNSNIYYSGVDNSNITGLSAGSYYVRYKGTNTTKPSDEVEIVIAPAAPRGTLKCTTIADSSMKIEWGGIRGAKGYEIYRSSTSSLNESDYTLVGTTTETSFHDLTTIDGKSYYYKLKSYNTDSKGNKYYSDLSGYTGGTARAAIKIFSGGDAVSSKDMYIGSTYTLKYVISSAYPDVKYNSAYLGNSALASIKVDAAGKQITVTPVAQGNTYLYIKSNDGNIYKCLLKISDSISIDETKISLYTGEKYTLKPVIAPSVTSISYSTGNAAVAKVNSDGILTAVSSGNTYVYAKASNGRTAKCLVTVMSSVPVTSVSVRYTSKTIQVKDSFQFTVTVTPANATNQTVTYKTGNTKIATVDTKGKVTGVSVGNTYLYATSSNGVSTKCLIKVIAKEIPVESVSVRYTSKTVYVNDTFGFTTTVTPSNATNQTITYKTGNTEVATVDAEGKVTGVGVGNTYLYATASNGVSTKCLIKVVDGSVRSIQRMEYKEEKQDVSEDEEEIPVDSGKEEISEIMEDQE